MVTFHVLAALSLRSADGRQVAGLLTGQKRVALLSYLALAKPRGFHRRDTLLALFWPTLDQKHARASLRNLLYQMRRSIGPGVIVGRGDEEVGLVDSAFWCDAVAFEQAVDQERSAEAFDLYRGDLLNGFYVSGISPDFEHWLDSERARLRGCAAECAWLLVDQAEQAGDRLAAASRARAAAQFTPFSDDAQIRLMSTLQRAGDRAGALRNYDSFAELLHRELGIPPSAELRAHAARIGAGPRPITGTAFRNGGRTSSARAIAVLPFEPLGARSSSDLHDSIHADLLTRLADISELKVIARTTVRQYRNTEKTVSEIGAELDVRWVLEGEVQEAPDQLRVNARLIDAPTDRQVWACEYRTVLTADQIFEIQSKITKQIAQSLQAKLTSEEQARVERRPTESLEAYRICIQGRMHLDQRSEEEMRQALHCFERVLELDPAYVLAWVGVADAIGLLHAYGYRDAEQAMPAAEAAVRRALELDDQSAEAHASLGRLRGQRQKALAAERALRRAIELKPNYAEAHNWRSVGYQVMGCPVPALESAQRAVELNPLSPEAVYNLAISSLISGDPQKALHEARRERALASSHGSGAFCEGLVLFELNRFEEAVSVLRDLSIPWAGSGPRATLALAHVALGDATEARRLLDEIEVAGDVFDSALVHAGLGASEAAFERLDSVDFHGVDFRLTYWPTIATRYLYQSVWGPLRADPRYRQLRRRMQRSWGLPAEIMAEA
jgi:TolB-like protein